MYSMINYTTEDLMKYLYKETTGEKSKAIENAIQSDWHLRDEYNALRESMQQLDGILESPRPQSIMAILNYAKTSAEVVQS